MTEMLAKRWRENNTLLCVGLDPDPARFPEHLKNRPEAIREFCCAIVDATAEYVCAFKPQIAYFASRGAEDQLKAIIEYIHKNYPGIPVILDAKRGDIGSTAKHYALEAYERFGADAVTLSPYMGFDSVEPYLAYAEQGAFLLCRTSNAGGNDLQMLDVGGKALFEHVAALVSGPWNRNGQLGLVVGATYPAELARVRAVAPRIPLLVPGIGAQGGDIEACVKAGMDPDGAGMVINSSRAILYAGKDENFAQTSAAAAKATRDAINAARGTL